MLHPVSVQERKAIPPAPWGSTGDLTQDQDLLHARQALYKWDIFLDQQILLFCLKICLRSLILNSRYPHSLIWEDIHLFLILSPISIFFLEVDVQISENMYSSMILFRRVFLLSYLKIDYFHAAFCWFWQIV